MRGAQFRPVAVGAARAAEELPQPIDVGEPGRVDVDPLPGLGQVHRAHRRQIRRRDPILDPDAQGGRVDLDPQRRGLERPTRGHDGRGAVPFGAEDHRRRVERLGRRRSAPDRRDLDVDEVVVQDLDDRVAGRARHLLPDHLGRSRHGRQQRQSQCTASRTSEHRVLPSKSRNHSTPARQRCVAEAATLGVEKKDPRHLRIRIEKI